MSDPTQLKHILVGTSGHIDHGKTRLVGRITNIDTDRLPEEKSRGISIDIGFAHWETNGVRFGFVDVPGHERFVRNMVAGATGVNLGLLVVAADDSVMPQTREHLEIMHLLGVRAGIVAITRTDLVDPEFVEIVKDDVHDLVSGTFLEGSPVVAVSSETGAGLDDLRASLIQLAADLEWTDSESLFRMPIDRVFSRDGHGTVVTGSVLSGEVHPADRLTLLPEGREVRVRAVQNHGIRTDDSGARQRTAVNLAGIRTSELHRGQELATPGYLQPTHRMIVEIQCLKSSPVVLRDRMTLNLHLGTTETEARPALRGRTIRPGASAFAELRMRDPVVAAWGQRFILRRTSPAMTIAGGRVLDPGVPDLKRLRDPEAHARAAAATSEADRLSFLLSHSNSVRNAPEPAAWQAGIPTRRYQELIDQLLTQGTLVRLGSTERSALVHSSRLKALSKSVLREVHVELDRQQPRRSLPRATVMSVCRDLTGPELLDVVINRLIDNGHLIMVGENLGPADAQVKLTKKQHAARNRMLDAIAAAGLSPPTRRELASDVGLNTGEVETLLNLCVEDGLLIPVSGNLYYPPPAVSLAADKCRELINSDGPSTMAAIRDAWNVSRKFAVPLCEYFDQVGLTVRDGDLRRLGPTGVEQC